MPVVVIAGLPKNIKLLKLITFLHGMVGDVTICSNSIKTRYSNDYTKKDIFVTLRSNDARKVRRALDGYVYHYAGREYPLQCWQEAVSGNQGRSNSQTGSEQNINQELQLIDQKIEMVRKERLLIEEESKLLMEKKKLEILKHIGVNDVEKLIKLQEIKNCDDLAEISELSNEVVEIPDQQRLLIGNKLPQFQGPCRVIFAEMRGTIGKYINPENKAILIPLIRSTIKKRLVVILQGKMPIAVQDIVQQYRAEYPVTTDDEMLKALIVTINQSCWPKPESDAAEQSKDANIPSDSQNEEFSSDLTFDEDSKKQKEITIANPEDADLVDIENDLDDWIEEDEQNSDSEMKESEETTTQENNENTKSIVEKDDVSVMEEIHKGVAVMDALEGKKDETNIQDVTERNVENQ